jgi:hypothetical protein
MTSDRDDEGEEMVIGKRWLREGSRNREDRKRR